MEYEKLCIRCGANYLRSNDAGFRQFGAQFAVAKRCTGDYLAVIDVDFLPEDTWIVKSLDVLRIESEAEACSTPQAFRNRSSPGGRLAHALDSFFEFCVENPFRAANNAHSMSGTMIVLRRNSYLACARDSTERKRAYYTEDFGISLRFTAAGKRIVQFDRPLGTGLSPTRIWGLAVQHAKWLDDCPQLLRTTLRGDLGLVQSIHLGFHATKRLFGFMLVVLCVLLLIIGSSLAVWSAVLLWMSFQSGMVVLVGLAHGERATMDFPLVSIYTVSSAYATVLRMLWMDRLLFGFGHPTAKGVDAA